MLRLLLVSLSEKTRNGRPANERGVRPAARLLVRFVFWGALAEPGRHPVDRSGFEAALLPAH